MGPTATESLIKAAAAGEGAREGGGARGKEWKEVGGNTGPRPPNPSRCARLPREPGWPGVQDQEPRIDPGPGGCGAPSVSCSLEERKKLGVLGRKSTLGPTTLSRTLGALHRAPSPGFRPPHQPAPLLRPPPPLLCSPVGLPARDPISRRRTEGSDSCLCSLSPHFINWRLGRRTVGTRGSQKEVARKVRARSCTWPGVKGCGSKSAAAVA